MTLQNKIVPKVPVEDWFHAPTLIPKFEDVQVPYTKWPISLPTVHPHPRLPPADQKQFRYLMKKKYVSGPMQFKPMLFKSQLY